MLPLHLLVVTLILVQFQPQEEVAAAPMMQEHLFMRLGSLGAQAAARGSLRARARQRAEQVQQAKETMAAIRTMFHLISITAVAAVALAGRVLAQPQIVEAELEASDFNHQ